MTRGRRPVKKIDTERFRERKLREIEGKKGDEHKKEKDYRPKILTLKKEASCKSDVVVAQCRASRQKKRRPTKRMTNFVLINTVIINKKRGKERMKKKYKRRTSRTKKASLASEGMSSSIESSR